MIGPHIGRAYIEATININGLKMTVGTVHMSFVPYFATTLKKKKEFELLYKILRNKNTRFIFSGDLNARPNSYIVKVLKRNFRHCGPSLKQPTWTTKPFDYMGFKENKLRWRIDYVFATSDMRVLSSKIIKTKYSDHLPILVEFEI
ncbi:endonuclease/exonuclease/phosphatase family protein [archaeon]|nr:endonuclease/exonuclease/phosphatase family protein [archaeon]